MKTIKAIGMLVAMMVLIGTAMAGTISAEGYATATAGEAMSEASVSYLGSLTNGGAEAGSIVWGDGASSSSIAGGELYSWSYANVNADTEASGEDAFGMAGANTYGSAYSATLETDADVNALAVGDEINVHAGAGTVATWELPEFDTPGIMSSGYMDASGSVVSTGYNDNTATSLSEGNAYAYGDVSAYGYVAEVGQTADSWSDEDGQHAEVANYGWAGYVGSYIEATVTSVAELYID